MPRISKIIWIEDDDGTMSLDRIPGVTQQDIFQASIVITDKGRILKNRFGPDSKVIPSFDLVKQDMPVKNKLKSTSKSKYRSIFDPMDVQAEL